MYIGQKVKYIGSINEIRDLLLHPHLAVLNQLI